MRVSGPGNPRSPLLLRYIGRLSELAGYVSAVLILVSMLVVCYGVALRYVFGASTLWQLELSTYFLMFAAFVGGAYGLKHGDHVNLALVVDRLPEKARLYVRLLASILGFVFIVIVALIAYDLWWETAREGRTSGTAWNVPLTYPYLIVPLGMTLIALQYLVIVVEILQQITSGQTSGQPPDEGGDLDGGQDQ
jgi:TRAP-type C4-dicarboxylate transport system permease small subunit